MKVPAGLWDDLVSLGGGVILCFSYEIAGTLGRDELEGDAEEDAVGCHADRQSAVREQAAGSGGLAGADGDATRTDGSCGSYGGCTGGTAEGAKGTRDGAALVASVGSCVHCLTPQSTVITLLYVPLAWTGRRAAFSHGMFWCVSYDSDNNQRLFPWTASASLFYNEDGEYLLGGGNLLLKYNSYRSCASNAMQVPGFRLSSITRQRFSFAVSSEQTTTTTTTSPYSSQHQYQSRHFVEYVAVRPTTTFGPKAYLRPFHLSVRTVGA